MEERWYIYSNRDNRFIKTIVKGKEGYDPRHYYHIGVEVVPTDKEGHLLVAQRAFTKRTGAGSFEFPAGSVIEDETPANAARRVLKEELGLYCRQMRKICESKVPGLKRVIFAAYIPELTQKPISLNERETLGYRFTTFDEWMNMISRGQFLSDRVLMYTSEFYEKLEDFVGTEEKEEKEVQPQRVLREVKTILGQRHDLVFPREIEQNITEPEVDILISESGEEIDVGGYIWSGDEEL